MAGPSMFSNGTGFNFQPGNEFTNVGGNYTKNITYDSSGLESLNICVSHDALYNSSARNRDPAPKCHSGTRERILQTIDEWVNAADSPHRILWLSGSPGFGKTTIAQTVAELYHGADKLAGSFFLSRSKSDRNTINPIIPTLVMQMASFMPDFRACVLDALMNDPHLPKKWIKTQLEELVVKPFRKITENNPSMPKPCFLVVIDGLDECTDGEYAQSQFVTTLGNELAKNQLPLCFMICSRPEAHITRAFDDIKSSHSILRVTLDGDPESKTQSILDVRKYLVDKFADISSKWKFGSHSWPSPEDINTLVQTSRGQFIYASTAVHFVGYEKTNPKKQLAAVLSSSQNDSSLFGALDRLYIEILKHQTDQVLLTEFLDLLVVLLTDPGLHQTANENVPFISYLLNLEDGEIQERLEGMHSLLEVSPMAIGARHISFLDFVQERGRSVQYCVNRRKACRIFLVRAVEAFVRHASLLKPASRYDDPDFGALHDTKKLLSFVSASRMSDDWWKILLPLQRLRYESIMAPHLYPVRWFIDRLISCPRPPGTRLGRFQISAVYNIWKWTFTVYAFVLYLIHL